MSATSRRRLTRRRFLRETAVAMAPLAFSGALRAPAARAQTQSRGRRVAVFGAGVAGLTAAHELAERGFEVTVYERDHLGGKAWSVPVPGSARPGREALPGEHGFRFFPGFYLNLGDTMRRIAAPGGGTIYDRLVRASTYRTSFAGRPDLTVPVSLPPAGLTPQAVGESVMAAFLEGNKLPPREAAYFANKLGVYVTSCDERRLGQWERTSWKDFIREDQMSEEYRKLVSRSLVRNLAATKSSEASTHSIGLVGEASAMSLQGRGNDKDATFDRVLDGPTSEVWLDQWISLLVGLGVKFRVGWAVKSLHLRAGRVGEALVGDKTGKIHAVAPDWFVCAIPHERMAMVLTPELLSADPGLEGIRRLRTDWMAGLQFYLREPLPLTNGHVNYVDSPFALTSISQAQFWKRPLASYGDGTVNESLSTIVSDWVTPGILFGKPAKDCTPEQIAQEVWAQIKAHVNDEGTAVLRDEMLHSWFLDPAVKRSGQGGLLNDTPLFIQNPGSWYDRPESATKIPNLFLAGDWVRTYINVTTMDGANQGGRQATNALLSAADSPAPRAGLWPLYVPPEYEPWRAIDRERYRMGEPNLWDPDQARPSHG